MKTKLITVTVPEYLSQKDIQDTIDLNIERTQKKSIFDARIGILAATYLWIMGFKTLRDITMVTRSGFQSGVSNRYIRSAVDEMVMRYDYLNWKQEETKDPT